MTDQTKNSAPPYPALPNERGVYRLLLNGAAFEKTTGRPLSGGFKRRPPAPDGKPRDVKGLSVLLTEPEDLSVLIERWKPKAIVGLLTGDIRAIENEPPLDVIQDAPAHANLIGLPAAGEDDDQAEYLATLLIRACTRVYPP